MARELPGFYYDEVKKKYFKIEPSTTAPSGAAWSADNVKRRKLEEKKTQVVQRHLEMRKGTIQHCRALLNPLTGGFLARELGRASKDLPAACWTLGLQEKGSVPFHDWSESITANIPCFYISNHDTKTDLGLVYGAPDERTLIASYIPRDRNDRINFTADPGQYPRGFQLEPTLEPVPLSQISSIKYHEPSHQMIVTSRAPATYQGICFFSPSLSHSRDDQSSWLIGQQASRVIQPHGTYSIHTSAPAPASSDLICAIGTSEGILGWNDQRLQPVWVSPPGGAGPESNNNSSNNEHVGETFSLDFLSRNRDILLAGGRSNRLWLLDLRLAAHQHEWIRHRSSIAHVRSVNEHQVLAAGPRSALSLYDLRFRRARPHRNHPLLTFPGYHNEAHMHIGFAVAADPAMGMAHGVVAAAHDDGAVALYSLLDGRRLGCPAVDSWRADGPVRCLAFETLPRDTHPSLFVGRGPSIEKYSFGTLFQDSVE